MIAGSGLDHLLKPSACFGEDLKGPRACERPSLRASASLGQPADFRPQPAFSLSIWVERRCCLFSSPSLSVSAKLGVAASSVSRGPRCLEPSAATAARAASASFAARRQSLRCRSLEVFSPARRVFAAACLGYASLSSVSADSDVLAIRN